VLTSKDIRVARKEASEWNEFLKYFEEVYNHSFAPRGYNRDVALTVFMQAGCSAPALTAENNDTSDESSEPDGDYIS
jgi:hypothetical protein